MRGHNMIEWDIAHGWSTWFCDDNIGFPVPICEMTTGFKFSTSDLKPDAIRYPDAVMIWKKLATGILKTSVLFAETLIVGKYLCIKCF
jgi:hypothetical protein